MYRNDTVIPFFSILFSAALFLMAYLDGQHIARLAGHTPEELSVGQIGLMAFGIVFFLYGALGYLSNWLEGEELRPHRKLADPGNTHVIGIVLSLLAVALSGFFARVILYDLQNETTFPALEGGLFGAIFLVAALLLVMYKKFYQDEEVLTEHEDSEVPW